MHHDTSDGNIWMWIPQTGDKHAVPNWFIGQNGFPHLGLATVSQEWYPRCPGICGDFGLALDMLNENSAANAVLTTVCPTSSLHAFFFVH